ncbi:hypothetical protein SERLA73DRAFT_150220 [Serpula lacrymans var. lacrymans S7.3]|uniref:Uncharacterized protein n=1 Tax=Serpula lacrymans var. lacrymans (strain S7.3) TaxID=936435 RepID=F8PLK3_SERL3|nr:hypothetical protein SERLA73DRAFT_150220 [Serpula lacrymans var. lacrymans S7.3]
MAMATSVSGQVPVKVLHQDGSINNSLIVDQALPDWPPLKAPEGCAPPDTHIQRGLLADWGFAAVFEDTEELAEHSDNSNNHSNNSKEHLDDVSEDSDQDDHYFGLNPGDVQKLQELLSKEGWQVGNRNHVLEHTPYEMKDADAKEKDDIKKWLNSEFTSMLTRSDAAFHKYQTFGRVDSLSLFLENNVSEYFPFMIPYFKRLCKVWFGSTLFLSKSIMWQIFFQHPCRNTHLGSARSCAWYRKGKLREILTQQNGDLERQGLLVEENLDNPYGPPHPFQEESIGDAIEDIKEDLFAFIPLKQPEQEDLEPGEAAGPSNHPNAISLNDNDDEHVEILHPTAGQIICMDYTLYERWRKEFEGARGAEDNYGDVDMDNNFPVASAPQDASLLDNPAHAKHIVYKPKKIFSNAQKENRIYNEMWTGKWWHAIQARLPKGAALSPVIIATDKT